MQSMSDFFSMGGYGEFVWSAYGAAALILVGLLVVSWKELRARQAEVTALEAASPRRRHQTDEAKSS